MADNNYICYTSLLQKYCENSDTWYNMVYLPCKSVNVCATLEAPPMAFKTDAHTKVNEPVFRFQLRTAHPRHRCQATKVVLNPRNHGTVLATLAVDS